MNYANHIILFCLVFYYEDFVLKFVFEMLLGTRHACHRYLFLLQKSVRCVLETEVAFIDFNLIQSDLML